MEGSWTPTPAFLQAWTDFIHRLFGLQHAIFLYNVLYKEGFIVFHFSCSEKSPPLEGRIIVMPIVPFHSVPATAISESC